YYPLYKSFKIIEKLKNYKSNNNLFNDLIKMQIEEPLKEVEIKKSIKSIGKISDDISKKVKEQYEENPYPRWRYSTRIPTTNFLSLLNYDIRPNKFISPNKFNNPKILIAGCGTGKQLNNILARENSNVVAFDLSLSSLAYAKRKIDEVGSKKIEFLHGDILQLNKLNRKFDIIECMGVLHHMENPVKGLNILKNLLEPDGVLKLGLYSEIARKHIIELRQFTKDRNFKNNIIDIRNFREKIKNHENKILRKVLNSNDFYSTSNVRDLIFHVQEYRFTIPQISQILKDNNLEFLGFTFPEIKKKYSRTFLDDKKNISLENWHKFENENPDSFRAMYQFWVKRKNND
ncbi:class I SAM-dependent methyltransferase, partial [Candidatus Pelagibacter sp.]|nr:class I SAM-dependent methyltransferase [Candidatus Pelagibacter sp.]